MVIIPIQNHQTLVRKTTEDARQYVYRVIKICILEFLLPPKQKLNEIDLAESLDVSRTPVHDTFFRLSRENLVDIYPKRGAFVSMLNTDRIEQAVWNHLQLDLAVLNSIYIKNPVQSKLIVLQQQVDLMHDFYNQGNLNALSGIVTEYLHQLYLLAGDMEFTWDSLQKTDVDFRRILHLVISNTTAAEGFIYDYQTLTDAISERSYDKSCDIYRNHLSRILRMIPLMRQIYPDYFTCQQAS